MVDIDVDLIPAEPRALMADDRLIRHLDDRAEKMIPASPAAGAKNFGIHFTTVVQKAGLSKWISLASGLWPFCGKREPDTTPAPDAQNTTSPPFNWFFRNFPGEVYWLNRRL